MRARKPPTRKRHHCRTRRRGRDSSERYHHQHNIPVLACRGDRSRGACHCGAQGKHEPATQQRTNRDKGRQARREPGRTETQTPEAAGGQVVVVAVTVVLVFAAAVQTDRKRQPRGHGKSEADKRSRATRLAAAKTRRRARRQATEAGGAGLVRNAHRCEWPQRHFGSSEGARVRTAHRIALHCMWIAAPSETRQL